MPVWAVGATGRLFKDKGPALLLALVLVFAAALRWNGLDWDQGHLFHPDERHILMVTAGLALPMPPDWSALLSPNSPLNPHSFAYGSLPFYLLKLVAQLLVSLGQSVPGLEALRPFGDLDHLRLVGRVLSGLFDLGSVALAYVIGCRLRDRRTGLLAAAFLGVTVINVQYAHFYASDTLLTLLVLATTLFSLDLVSYGNKRAAVLAGVCFGLAMGTKTSALPLVAVLGTALLLRFFVGRSNDEGSRGTTHLCTERRATAGSPYGSGYAYQVQRAIPLFVLIVVSAAVAFAIVEPYALLDFNTFWRNIIDESNMARGIADLPYTRQYANTTPYWYFIGNLIWWGMGPPLALCVIGGTLVTLAKAIIQPRAQLVILFAWAIPYFALAGSFQAKFLRYLLPLTPFLCIFAAYGLVLVLDRVSIKHQWPRRAWLGRQASLGIRVAIAMAVVGGAAYALAFANVYATEHTAVRASEWIYHNVPPRSRLLTEHWEEGLPVPMIIDRVAYDPERYQNLTFPGYDPDSPAKFQQLTQLLRDADYIVFFSNRLYDTIPRLPNRYPITSRYYHLLFGEQLGFRLEAYFTAYPSLLGVTLVEDTFSDPRLPVPAALRDLHPSPITLVPGKADESFSVYDHPKVLIFEKERSLSEGELRALFGAALSQPSQEAAQAPAPAKSLTLSSTQQAAITAGGTFRDLFDPGGLENRFPLVVWGALMVLLGLLGWPMAFIAFRRLPDRGYLLARPLAILLLTWFDWMLVSLGVLENTRGAAFLALFLLAGISSYFAWRQRGALRRFWLERRREIVVWEAVFWAAFALFLIVRLANPDLWHPARGGEKPMDLAYLMAAIKSAIFPPYDPWFAGGYLNYYYYGQVIVATLIKVAGIVPTTAYNLVVPLLFALTAGGAFSAGYNLTAGGRRAAEPAANPWRDTALSSVAGDRRSPLRVVDAKLESHGPGINGWRTIAGLGTAAVAVLFGNLGGALQLLDQISHLGPAPFRSQLPGIEGLATLLAGLWRMLVHHQALAVATDWYWASTRVIQGTINEFPFFTFLYADLHAHLIALPFTLLALALAIDLIKGARAGGKDSRGENLLSAERFARWLVPGLIIGALMPINSWDFPTYLTVYGTTLLVVWFESRPLSLAGLGAATLRMGTLLALSYLLYWPFHSNFQQWYTGVEPISDKSNPVDYVKIHGLFLFAIVSFLVVETAQRYRHTGLMRAASQWLHHWQRLHRLVPLRRRLVKNRDYGSTLAAYGIITMLALMVTLHLLGMTLVALLFGLLAWVAFLLLHGRNDQLESAFALVLFATGLALSILVELVAIRGDVGRMNTVFKFYIQIWILWSVAGVFATIQGYRAIRKRGRVAGELWRFALVLLVAGALVYPVVGGLARVRDRYDTGVPPTLDGTAYMSTATFREENRQTKRATEIHLGTDLPAMRWLQDNVAGTPVILEGWAPLYHWGARYSIYTGLPTVVGWDWHQKQQRWGYQADVDRRVADVRSIYDSPNVDRAADLLAQYDVRYIIIGDLERAVYDAAGLAKFDGMVGRSLELVYENKGVKIYRRL